MKEKKTRTRKPKAAPESFPPTGSLGFNPNLPHSPFNPNPALVPSANLPLTAGNAPAIAVELSSQKIEGKKTDFVGVRHYHKFLRRPYVRVFNNRIHGEEFESLAQSFSAANPWPGAGHNELRYLSESEAHEADDSLKAALDAVNARREEQRRRGHRVTP